MRVDPLAGTYALRLTPYALHLTPDALRITPYRSLLEVGANRDKWQWFSERPQILFRELYQCA